MMNSSCNS